MLRQKLGKVRFYVSLFSLVTLTSLLVVGQLAQKVLVPVVVDAQTPPEPRVLQAETTCVSSTLSASPTTVPNPNSNVSFTVVVKNGCTSTQNAGVQVRYGNQLLLKNLTPGSELGEPPVTLTPGESRTFNFSWNLSGLQGLAGINNFYSVAINKGQMITSSPVAIAVTSLSGTQAGAGSCLSLDLKASPTSVGDPGALITVDYTINNICADSILTQFGLVHGNDSLIKNLPITAPVRGSLPTKGVTTFTIGSLGSTATSPTTIYTVAKYIDPRNSSQNIVVSNKIPITVTTPGAGVEGETGDGQNVNLPEAQMDPSVPICVGVMCLPVPASAVQAVADTRCIGLIDTPLCVINLVLATVGNVIQTMIKIAFSLFVGPVIEGLVSVRTYTDNFADVVYTGWVLLRNLANIIFILAIVAMGVATVFRISGYAFRDMMVKLIIGAFLVNFSLVIPQAILGIAETVQNQFLAPGSGAIRQIASPLFTTDLFAGSSALGFGSASNTIRIFLNVWVSVFAFIMFFGLMVLLAIRMVIIWLLLMTSPLPYAAMVLPATRNLSKIWWTWLIKWAFMTPVIAFMLNLTAIIVKSGTATLESLVTADPTIWGQNAGFMFAFGNAMIPIVFLFATLKVAGSMASGTGVGWIDKGIGMAGNLAGIGAGSVLGYAIGKPAKKILYEPAKDKLQTGYLKGVNKILAPSKTDKGAKGLLKRTAFNVLSGGQAWKASEEDRKGLLEHAKLISKETGRDYRNVQKGLTPSAVERTESVARTKDVKEFGETISRYSVGQVKEAIREIMRRPELSYNDQTQLEALVQRGLQNKAFASYIGSDFGNNISAFYSRVRAKSGGGTTGKEVISRIAQDVTVDSLGNGKFHLVTNPDAPDAAPAARRSWVNQRISGSSAETQATIDGNTFATIDRHPTTNNITGVDIMHPDMAPGLARLVYAFKDPARASELGAGMNSDRKEEYIALLSDPVNGAANRAMLEAELVTLNGGPDFDYRGPDGSIYTMPVGDLVDSFLASL